MQSATPGSFHPSRHMSTQDLSIVLHRFSAVEEDLLLLGGLCGKVSPDSPKDLLGV